MSVDMFERRFRIELEKLPLFVPDDNRDGAVWKVDFPAWRALFSSLCLYGHSTGYRLPSFEEFFPGLEDLLQRVDFTKLPYKRSIKYEGRFNWKTMVDGYQECLHCQYTHPSFSVYYPPASYAVKNHHNFSQTIETLFLALSIDQKHLNLNFEQFKQRICFVLGLPGFALSYPWHSLGLGEFAMRTALKRADRDDRHAVW